MGRVRVGRVRGMLAPRAQLVLVRQRRVGWWARCTLVVAWEPARRRTIVRRRRPMRLDVPALVFGHFYSTDLNGYQHYAVRVVASRAATPEEALDAPAYSLRLPHCSDSVSVCLGNGLNRVVDGSASPDDVFWCTDFMDGGLHRRELVGRALQSPRLLFDVKSRAPRPS